MVVAPGQVGQRRRPSLPGPRLGPAEIAHGALLQAGPSPMGETSPCLFRCAPVPEPAAAGRPGFLVGAIFRAPLAYGMALRLGSHET